MQEAWTMHAPTACIRPCKSAPCSPMKPVAGPRTTESFHVQHKVPTGVTPYVRAKRVQLVDKDPDKAITLFWAAINAGDRVDSALKDMAIVMKQQNRAEEAVEAIKSLRCRCSEQAQESLDNILLDLYKRCGRLDDQIGLLKYKLQLIQKGLAFNAKRTKTARSQGRKFQVSIEQEATRLLRENYVEAEAAYRRALLIDSDNNKMCNLGIYLMQQGRIAEAKETLKQVKPAVIDNIRGADSHLKAYERAQEMLRDLEAKLLRYPGHDRVVDQSWLFDAFLGSSSIWQAQPCVDYLHPPRDGFGDENANTLNTLNNGTKPEHALGKSLSLDKAGNMMLGRTLHSTEFASNTALNIDARPFFSSRLLKEVNVVVQHSLHDPLGNLKRTRSGDALENAPLVKVAVEKAIEQEVGKRSTVSAEDKWPDLPDNNAFHEAIVAAVLAPVLQGGFTDTNNIKNPSNKNPASCEEVKKMGKRLRIFQDITQQVLNSPK